MKRWNGWGDDTHDHPLPDGATEFLQERIGPAERQANASFEDVLATVPGLGLPAHPQVTTDPADRLRHARGQSFPDWVALRSGKIGHFPDGVAYPNTADDVRDLIDYARSAGIKLIPYGGGTSVAGHINPAGQDAPVVTVDMGRMTRLIDLNETTQLARFGAGVNGPNLEAQLRARGYTLGHYPQSFEYSTLGGWIATRSSGQQSLHYGRIEDLFAGGAVQTPRGELCLPAFPASAAGPDLREMVLGSEGRLGIITEATVRISPEPEHEEFRAIFFPDFASGRAAVRQIAQARIPLTMLRLSTGVETETNLALAGRQTLIGAVEALLSVRGVGEGKAMLLYGYSGSAKLARPALNAVAEISQRHGGVSMGIGKAFGSTWQKGRFRTPYLRNTLWDYGYGVDTVETATTWDNAPHLLDVMEAALKKAMARFNERIHVFTHYSHLYPHGTSIYTSYVFRLGKTPDATLERWHALKDTVSRTIVENSGTISHQHGVGTDHAPYLHVEKGELGMQTIHTLLDHFDPDGILNPGKLIQPRKEAEHDLG